MVDSNPDVPESSGSSTSNGVKAARPDIITFERPIDTNIVETIIFEKLGGQELINIARHDLIVGQKIDYVPIKGLTKFGSEFNPLSLIALQGTSDSVFNNFPIKLENKIPTTKPVPVELLNNEVIVSVINLEADEQVEVQILTYGDLLNDTIYEEDL